MENFFFLPPIAFSVVFVVVFVSSGIFSRLAFRKNGTSKGAKKAYACGEDFVQHLIQPDYSQFFPFAFFFTILHVVALMLATVPIGAKALLILPLVYVVGAVIGLSILLRK